MTGRDVWIEPAGSELGLVDLLDRVVERGVVVSGDVVIALAGIDLIRLDLRALLVGIVGGGRGEAS